jgi:hypothetical protein
MFQHDTLVGAELCEPWHLCEPRPQNTTNKMAAKEHSRLGKRLDL